MASKIDLTQVKHIAHLARLNMGDAEVAKFQEQLSEILSYIEQLNELDTTDVPPTAHPLPVHTVLREDVVLPSYGPDVALQNAPGRDGSFFVVPKVLNQEDSN